MPNGSTKHTSIISGLDRSYPGFASIDLAAWSVGIVLDDKAVFDDFQIVDTPFDLSHTLLVVPASLPPALFHI